MNNFWDILLLAGLLWILFIAGVFIYHRVIKPIKSGRASRMEETITLKSKDMPPWKPSAPLDAKTDTYGIVTKVGKVKNHFRKPKTKIVKQNNPETD